MLRVLVQVYTLPINDNLLNCQEKKSIFHKLVIPATTFWASVNPPRNIVENYNSDRSPDEYPAVAAGLIEFPFAFEDCCEHIASERAHLLHNASSTRTIGGTQATNIDPS